MRNSFVASVALKAEWAAPLLELVRSQDLTISQVLRDAIMLWLETHHPAVAEEIKGKVGSARKTRYIRSRQSSYPLK